MLCIMCTYVQDSLDRLVEEACTKPSLRAVRGTLLLPAFDSRTPPSLRRGATAMHSESLSRALQWFQTVQRSRPLSPVASARRLGRRNQEQGPEEEEEEEPSFLSSVLESFSLPSFF